MNIENPFSLSRASDFTNNQINSLWVDFSVDIAESIIEPRGGVSKFILGSKGIGKTHLLRYYSYPVIKLRSEEKYGVSIVKKAGFLAVFLRATGIDATRFGYISDAINWQYLFGIYLELRLAESVLECLCDIKKTSSNSTFDDSAFLSEIRKNLSDSSLDDCETIESFYKWVLGQRRQIDESINNAAFTGKLTFKPSFSIGGISLGLSKSFRVWSDDFSKIPLLYLIDEIENFSIPQQEVINTLIRYGESYASFRVTGRRYAIKTYNTIDSGEQNREGSEYATVYLDDFLLANNMKFESFAKKFIIKRLNSAGFELRSDFEPTSCFDEISSSDFYMNAFKKLNIDIDQDDFIKSFLEKLKHEFRNEKIDILNKIIQLLTEGFPIILQKLNILRFCKKYRKSQNIMELAEKISKDAYLFFNTKKKPRDYVIAYNHYASDLFSQICYKSDSTVYYAGFKSFIQMSSSNPRNLLIILSKIYDLAKFKGMDFISEEKLSVSLQTEAIMKSSLFLYESDTNFGARSDVALSAINRLANILRAARFAFNIPEVSPLAFSFNDNDLSEKAREVIKDALSYSLIFEELKGRPARNDKQLYRKIYLNPLLSPKWQLPISVRGDISLNRQILLSIFDSDFHKDFEALFRSLDKKWNSLSKGKDGSHIQGELF